MDEVDLALAVIPVLGVACLWVASQLKVPAILLLLPGGILVGPVAGLVNPDELFGESLYPAVSLAVAVLLFDGGLGLRFDQLERRNVVLRLVTIGVGVTFAIGAVGAVVLFGAPTGVAVLLGAVLVVSGPTVVGPILQQVRPREPSGSILRWEGIGIDPIGATLGIIVLGVVLGQGDGWAAVGGNLALTVVGGIVVGGAGAALLSVALRTHRVPDNLQAVVALGMALAVFAVGNELRPEAGLFAATVLGVGLANQRAVTVGHIAQFGESIGQILLAILFVVLGATISLNALADVAGPALVLTGVLVFVARPLAVWLATIGTSVPLRQRAFMAWLAPRGIVAAATSALFTAQLTAAGIDGSVLAPVAFVVIIATVCLYGLTARPVARLLRVTDAPRKGLVVVGAPPWARQLSGLLMDRDLPVVHITLESDERDAALAEGLLVYPGTLEPDELHEAAESIGVRQVLATGSDPALDDLCSDRLAESVGREHVFGVTPADATVASSPGRTRSVRPRRAFSHHTTTEDLRIAWHRGGRFVVLPTGTAAGPDDLPVVRLAADLTPSLVTERSRSRPPSEHERLIVLRSVSASATDAPTMTAPSGCGAGW
ncbi:MAG: cation:proton antiporter [Acidimicrobiia bacterium]|nr:cation:proton antiporter [Acidimicrobiia bacterium]